MTNLQLFEFLVQYYREVSSATLCPILGPINFVMWLKDKDVGYTDDMMSRVLTLYDIVLKVVNSDFH